MVANEISRAVSLYRKALKLNPSLEIPRSVKGRIEAHLSEPKNSGNVSFEPALFPESLAVRCSASFSLLVFL